MTCSLTGFWVETYHKQPYSCPAFVENRYIVTKTTCDRRHDGQSSIRMHTHLKSHACRLATQCPNRCQTCFLCWQFDHHAWPCRLQATIHLHELRNKSLETEFANEQITTCLSDTEWKTTFHCMGKFPSGGKIADHDGAVAIFSKVACSCSNSWIVSISNNAVAAVQPCMYPHLLSRWKQLFPAFVYSHIGFCWFELGMHLSRRSNERCGRFQCRACD